MLGKGGFVIDQRGMTLNCDEYTCRSAMGSDAAPRDMHRASPSAQLCPFRIATDGNALWNHQRAENRCGSLKP